MNLKKDQIYYFFKKLLGAEILVGLTGVISDLCSVAVNGRMLPSTVLAAISLTVTINCILSFAGKAVRNGSMVVFGRQMGEGNVKDICSIGVSSLVCLGVVGIVMFGLVQFFPEKFAALAGATPGKDGFSDVVGYFRGYILSPIFNMFVSFLLTLLQMRGKTSCILVTTAELFAGNLVFAFLNASFFGATAFGAGIALSCAQLIPLVHLLVVSIRDETIPPFSMKAFSLKILMEILLIGAPISAVSFFLGFRNTFMNHLLYRYGSMAALSAKAVYSTVIGFSDIFVSAVPAVAVIVAGIFVGERNREALALLFRRSLKLTVVLTMADMILIMLLAHTASEFLSSDSLVITYACRFIRISVTAAVFESVTMLLLNYYIALDQHHFVSIVNVFHCIILHMVFSLAASAVIGVYGVMASYPLTEITTLLFLILWAFLKKRKLRCLEDLLPLNPETEPHSSLVHNLYSVNDVQPFMEQIQLFCRENGISERTGFWMQLCCEEMLANIFEHSFAKHSVKNGIVHVFIAYDNDGGIELLIRDNGPLFDPGTIEQLFYPEQPEKNIGIRLVQKIADEFVWQNVIGMNTLIIRLKVTNQIP